MKRINKKWIYDDVINKKSNWGIEKDIVTDVLRSQSEKSFEKYGAIHYEIMYRILMRKVDLISKNSSPGRRALTKSAYLSSITVKQRILNNDAYKTDIIGVSAILVALIGMLATALSATDTISILSCRVHAWTILSFISLVLIATCFGYVVYDEATRKRRIFYQQLINDISHIVSTDTL